MPETVNPLNTIAERTDSPAVAIALIIAVVLLAIGVPMYKWYVNLQKARIEADKERDRLLAQVVDRNSEAHKETAKSQLEVAHAIGGLKALLEANNTRCQSCQEAQLDRFEAVFRKQDAAASLMTRAVTLLENCPTRKGAENAACNN